VTTWEIELGGEEVSRITKYRAQFSRILRDHPCTGFVAKMKGAAPEPASSEATAESPSGVVATLDHRPHEGRARRARTEPAREDRAGL